MPPFVKLIIPAGLGILFSHLTGLGWIYAAICFAVCWSVSWFCLKRPGGGFAAAVYPWLAVFFFFAGAASLARPDTAGLPDGHYIRAEIVIAEEPVGGGKWRQALGYVASYGPPDGSGHVDAGFGVQLYVDPGHEIRAGDRILVRGYFNAFGDGEGSYGALMMRRGVAGRMYVTAGSLLASEGSGSPWRERMHNAAVCKMSRLPGDGELTAVVAAMVSGDKRQIPRSTREAYRGGGGAHLLAVSGLHVGIVFVMVNLLLYLLPVVRRGHIIKNLVAVAAVWLFAVAAGSSPSVVRAALMFSLVQFALAGGTTRSGLNAIAASALLMLAVDPNYAADPSFVLSYAAVLAIILFFGPLYRMVKTQYKALNALISVYLVGIIASLAVAPFVAYWFGRVPLAGILVNPVVILTAHIIVAAGALWLVCPLDFGGEVLGWIATRAVAVQDRMMEWCAGLQYSDVEISLPLWAAVAIYGAVILTAYPLGRYSSRRSRRLNLAR